MMLTLGRDARVRFNQSVVLFSTVLAFMLMPRRLNGPCRWGRGWLASHWGTGATQDRVPRSGVRKAGRPRAGGHRDSRIGLKSPNTNPDRGNHDGQGKHGTGGAG